jgi:hypothetical protein
MDEDLPCIKDTALPCALGRQNLQEHIMTSEFHTLTLPMRAILMHTCSGRRKSNLEGTAMRAVDQRQEALVFIAFPARSLESDQVQQGCRWL